MTYLESVTQAYERGYKIGKVHGRAENIETEETLRARVAELEAKLEAVKTAATKGGLSSHQRWEQILVAIDLLKVTL